MKYCIRWVQEGATQYLHTDNLGTAMQACNALAHSMPNTDVELWQGVQVVRTARNNSQLKHEGTFNVSA